MFAIIIYIHETDTVALKNEQIGCTLATSHDISACTEHQNISGLEWNTNWASKNKVFGVYAAGQMHSILSFLNIQIAEPYGRMGQLPLYMFI